MKASLSNTNAEANPEKQEEASNPAKNTELTSPNNAIQTKPVQSLKVKENVYFDATKKKVYKLSKKKFTFIAHSLVAWNL